MDTERHAGKTAIIAGAASGIGLATALRLAREGARVIGCNRSEDSRLKAEALFVAQGLSVTMVAADVSKQDEVDHVVALAEGKVDILANVAGAMDNYATAVDIADDVWARVLDVNLTGPMRMCRAVLPLMQARGGGSIVTVASRASVGGGPAGVAYVSSKHGVLGLVKSVAWYFGPDGIRSNAVLPGRIRTDMAQSSQRSGWAFERAAIAKASIPERSGEADEVAATISWLASDEASYVNGAVVSVDGGWSSA